MDHKIWDGMAIDYDNSVENNQDPIIINYLKKEIDILTNLCKKVYDQNKNSSIIDMGAGTGRVIFELDEKLHQNTIQFCGVEISEPMLNLANQKSQDHKKNSNIDRCMNYFYYLREFNVFTSGNETILIGVASNYANNYPDAPEVWLINKNNVIDKIGDTNIEKYSLNFELSK